MASQQNRIAGLSGLLETWDVASRARPHRRVPMMRGRLGNVNLDGGPFSPAATLPPHHPQFLESLEPGIRPLVIVLTQQLGLVTYSSCEGHATDDGRILGERSVDVIPRDAAEKRRATELLTRAVEAASRSTPRGSRAVLRLEETLLESDDVVHHCLGIRFKATTSRAAHYFRDVEVLHRELLERLGELAGEDG